MNNDTICALATAPGGALGIVRVSGSNALAIVSTISSVSCDTVPANTIHYGHIVECDAVSQQLKDLEEKITSIKIGDGADLKRKQVHKMIDDLSRTKKDIEDKLSQKVFEAKKTKNDIVSNLSLKFNEHVTNQLLMEQTIEADKKMIERCKQSIKECDEELERLRLAWPTRKFEFDSQMSVCPTCGQPLPLEMLEERKIRLRNNFIDRYAVI